LPWYDMMITSNAQARVCRVSQSINVATLIMGSVTPWSVGAISISI
jgi:hypothetical protein